MKKWLPGSEDELDAKLEVSDSDSEEAAAALSPVAPEADIRAVYVLADALGLDAPVGDSQQPGPQAPTPPSLGVAAPPGYACEEHADGEPTATPSGEASTQPLVPPAPATQPVTPDGPVARTTLSIRGSFGRRGSSHCRIALTVHGKVVAPSTGRQPPCAPSG